MSRVPMGSAGAPWAEDPETSIETGFAPQGIGADLIATMEGFSREDVDAFALTSQKKAAAAQSKKCVATKKPILFFKVIGNVSQCVAGYKKNFGMEFGKKYNVLIRVRSSATFCR